MQEDRDYWERKNQDLDRCMQEDCDYHRDHMQKNQDFFTNLLNQLQAMSPPTAYHQQN